MKILQTINFGYETGGAEEGVIELKKHLEKKGHIVRVLSSDIKPELTHFSDYEFRGINPKNPLKLLFHLFNPYSYLELRRILKNDKPDLIHLHTMSEFSPSILFLLKNIPTVITIHGPEEFIKSLMIWVLQLTDFKNNEYCVNNLNLIGKIHYLYYVYIQSYFYKIGFKNIDLTISVSNFINKVTTKDLPNNITIYNGVELFQSTDIKNMNNLLYVGRLEKAKGIGYIIDAMRLVVKRYPKASLNIVGEGTYKSTAIAMVKKYGLDKYIRFLGQIAHKDIEKYYKDSTVILIPSIVPEAFGRVGIEAMSVGRPVIASRVGGIPEWLDNGKTGFLVEPGNSEQIAQKVIQLFKDKELMQQMSVNARKKAEQFSIEKHVDKIEKIYIKVIKKYKTK